MSFHIGCCGENAVAVVVVVVAPWNQMIGVECIHIVVESSREPKVAEKLLVVIVVVQHKVVVVAAVDYLRWVDNWNCWIPYHSSSVVAAVVVAVVAAVVVVRDYDCEDDCGYEDGNGGEDACEKWFVAVEIDLHRASLIPVDVQQEDWD